MSMSVRNRMLGLRPTEEVTTPVTEIDPDIALELQRNQPVLPAVAQVVEPAAPAVAPAAIVEVPELRYEYQPTDEHGRKLGGKQVIKYRTSEELAEKLTAQNVELVRKLREVTRKQKLGITDDTPLPDGTEQFDIVELKEKNLSTEEVFQLTQDMNDPAKFTEARDRLLESAIGMSPAALREHLNKQQMMVLQNTVLTNYQTFEKQCPEFWPCPENKQVLTDWMESKGVTPTVANFKYALSKVREAGLLLDPPTVREETPVPAAVAPVAPVVAPVSTEPVKAVVPATDATRISETTSPQQQRQPLRLPSGLNESIAPSNSGTSSARISLTLADFDAMPADEMKKKLRDPHFAAMVNELLKKKPVQAQ
jgi:hypothetical protein